MEQSTNYPVQPSPARPVYRDRGAQLQRARKRRREQDVFTPPSSYLGFAGRQIKAKTNKPRNRKMENRNSRLGLSQRVRCEDTPFRGFFLVAQPYWPRVEAYLNEHGLAYEYFHASFVNACHRLARALSMPNYKDKKEWEVEIREILKDYPVPANRYIDALEIFRKECDPPSDEITGRPIKSTNNAEHRTAQLALYSVLFSRAERRKHVEERKETESLALPALLDALDDIEVLEKGRAEGLVDDENAGGGVPLSPDVPLERNKTQESDAMEVD